MLTFSSSLPIEPIEPPPGARTSDTTWYLHALKSPAPLGPFGPTEPAGPRVLGCHWIPEVQWDPPSCSLYWPKDHNIHVGIALVEGILCFVISVNGCQFKYCYHELELYDRIQVRFMIRSTASNHVWLSPGVVLISSRSTELSIHLIISPFR